VGTFRSSIEIGDPQGQCWETLEAVVDTGASYTWAPREILVRLGVQPQFRREFVTADGRIIEREMAVTMARWNGQVLPTLVVFGDEGSQPLLGAYTLEGFGLAPDPVNRRLIPVRGLALVLLWLEHPRP
jgi:clan AA aspartic protease